jgi:hypothetical protein
MSLELSTMNILLGLGVALQAWMVRELFALRSKITRIETILEVLPCGQCEIKTKEYYGR